jgi:hypothetical protein
MRTRNNDSAAVKTNGACNAAGLAMGSGTNGAHFLRYRAVGRAARILSATDQRGFEGRMSEWPSPRGNAGSSTRSHWR